MADVFTLKSLTGTTLFNVDDAGNLTYAGGITFADNDALIFGDGADISIAWDGTRLNVTQGTVNSEIRWGVDGAGIDQRFYGDTASTFALWDQSADSLIFADNAKTVFGTGSDIAVYWDATNLKITQAAPNSAIDLGVDGAGIDVIMRGDTAGAAMTWDQSADALALTGVAKVTGLRTFPSTTPPAITAATTLVLGDSGGVFTIAQTSAYDIALPDPTTAGGCVYTFVVSTAGAFNVTISTTGASTFIGTIVNDITSVIPATGGTLTIATGTAAVGDTIVATSLTTGLYLIRAITSAAGGITVA